MARPADADPADPCTVVVATAVLPPVRTIFSTTPLTPAEWGIALGFSFIPFAAYEIWKAIRRRWFQPD
jgi:hypothetical protein